MSSVECSICGTKNSYKAVKCELCETTLSSQLNEKKEKEPLYLRPRKRKISSFKMAMMGIVALLGVVFTWMYSSTLLSRPISVVESRDNFNKLADSYSLDTNVWVDKKNQILQMMRWEELASDFKKDSLLFEEGPLEILYAYL